MVLKEGNLSVGKSESSGSVCGKHKMDQLLLAGPDITKPSYSSGCIYSKGPKTSTQADIGA